jgi:hypothetical protein
VVAVLYAEPAGLGPLVDDGLGARCCLLTHARQCRDPDPPREPVRVSRLWVMDWAE